MGGVCIIQGGDRQLRRSVGGGPVAGASLLCFLELCLWAWLSAEDELIARLPSCLPTCVPICVSPVAWHLPAARRAPAARSLWTWPWEAATPRVAWWRFTGPVSTATLNVYARAQCAMPLNGVHTRVASACRNGPLVAAGHAPPAAARRVERQDDAGAARHGGGPDGGGRGGAHRRRARL